MAMMHIAIETLCLGVSCHDYLLYVFFCLLLIVGLGMHEVQDRRA